MYSCVDLVPRERCLKVNAAVDKAAVDVRLAVGSSLRDRVMRI